MTFDEKEHLRGDLIRAYEAASQDEKAVIQTASVFYQPVGRVERIVRNPTLLIQDGAGGE